jgi:hypothetical protein
VIILSKKNILKVVLLALLSLSLINLIVKGFPGMGISSTTIWGAWIIIFAVILLLFKIKQGISLLSIFYSIFISLLMLILIPTVSVFFFMMNSGQK